MHELDLVAPGMQFPIALGNHGGIRVAGPDDSVHQMLLQILFTSPGERVNRPDFGVGVRDLVFEPTTAFLASTVRRRLQDNLQTYLSSVRLVALAVDPVYEPEPMLVIRIAYEIRGSASGTQELHVEIPRMEP